LGPSKSGTQCLSLFSLMVNPPLLLIQYILWGPYEWSGPPRSGGTGLPCHGTGVSSSFGSIIFAASWHILFLGGLVKRCRSSWLIHSFLCMGRINLLIFWHHSKTLCHLTHTSQPNHPAFHAGPLTGGESGYRPNLQKIVKEIRGVFVFLFLGGGRFCLRQQTEVQ